MSSENISELIASLQGDGAVNGLNADISFPADAALSTDTSSPSGNLLATKSYVDSVAEGLHVLESCKFATTANGGGTYTRGSDNDANTAVGSTLVVSGSIDGTNYSAIANGVRILIKDETDAENNGIYTKTSDTLLTRATDFDTFNTLYTGENSDIRLGDFVFISAGTANIGHGFVMTGAAAFAKASSPDIGTAGTRTDITFTQFSGISETVTVAQGGTGATSLTDGGVLLGSGTGAITAMGVLLNGEMIVGDGTTDPVAESGATLRTSIGVGTGDSPQFTGINLGHATNTTLTQASSSGDVNIEGNIIYRAGGTDVAVTDGGTGLSAVADNSVLISTSADTLAALTISGTDDLALMYDHSGTAIVWTSLASVCFLKGTKITLPDFSQKSIEDLTLADDVLTYNIDTISDIKNKKILKNVQMDTMNGKFSQSGIRNIWINPTDSYLVINEKLKVTKNHIVHFKRDNQFYFRYAEHLSIGDELFTDKGNYESVESIEEVRELTNVYNFELDKDNTYFAENYLVHHYCELCSGYSNIL